MTVLARGEGWLVMDKRVGEVTAPPTARPGPTLLDRARAAAPDAVLHHPLTRLDAEVSGAVLFALSRKAIERAAETPPAKRYVALAARAPDDDVFAWTWPVGLHPRRPTLRACGAGLRESQPAETRGEVVARVDGAALLVLTPVTGRTHQLRVHAAHAGAALLGDAAYGGPSRVTRPDGGVVAAPRVMLHAWRVGVPRGPFVESPLPPELVAAWRALGGDDPEALLTPARGR